ncbi:hypothetical protein HanPI659440_Chr11g0426681 [Helianthus annuus]|nr:hypothetical protein HanPI659440_Chr11g0426681 [Helianthus annuus]
MTNILLFLIEDCREWRGLGWGLCSTRGDSGVTCREWWGLGWGLCSTRGDSGVTSFCDENR